MDYVFRAEALDGKVVVGQLLKNKIATYIITEENPHECTQYGYIEIDEYYRVKPETVELLKNEEKQKELRT